MSPGDKGARRSRGVLFALVSAAGFSTLGLFARLMQSEGFSIQQALAWRFTVASLLLWLFVGLSARRPATRRPPFGRKLVPVLVLGLVGFAPQAGLYFLTLRFLDPGITSLLLYLYPSVVILIVLIFFRRPPSAVQAISLVLSTAGCAITFLRPGSRPLIGLALGVAIAVIYAAYLVVSERLLGGVDSIRATALIMLVSAGVYWIATAASGTFKVPGGPGPVAGILGIGLFATVLPITALFFAMKEIGASDTSLVSTLEPALTVLLSALLLGERLAPAQAVGGALILAAVAALRFDPAASGGA